MNLNSSITTDKQNSNLPEDFLQFISKNYKTINDIEKKVEQFQNDSWNNFYKRLGCRSWRNLRLCSTKCDSVDSCFSDRDIKKIIRARLKPKMKRIESSERIEFDEGALEELQGQDPSKKSVVDFSYLSHNFPMVFFAPNLDSSSDKALEDLTLNVSVTARCSSTRRRFIVEGSKLPIVERNIVMVNAAKSSKNLLNKKEARFEICSGEESDTVDFLDSEKRQKKKQAACDEPRSRQLLTLTLPPLHQSVLTLLGQKSTTKPSPRNLNKPELSPTFETSSANKAKKLRRHGRKKKAKEDGKESEEKELEKSDVASMPGGRGDNEELQETQLNTLQNLSDPDEESDENAANELKKKGNSQIPLYANKIRSLRDVLDEHLSKKAQWSPKEMENLNAEIEKLSTGLKKYRTDFKTKSISIKEDAWLAFPRTWTRASATFGVPTNSKLLENLNPVEYLRNHVTITEPRLHLYNLIYQRYRVLENPTGKSITVKSLQRALTEVLGRPFTDSEMDELKGTYLNILDNFVLDTKAFAGICAFSERVYGKYALEECQECIVCSRHEVHDKERCHMKRRSELEEMDLSYLSSKIKFGEAAHSISHLVQILMKTGPVKQEGSL